jgi:hypothetical protein
MEYEMLCHNTGIVTKGLKKSENNTSRTFNRFSGKNSSTGDITLKVSATVHHWFKGRSTRGRGNL